MVKILKSIKTKINVGATKVRNLTFRSSKENIRHILSDCKSSVETLRKKVGNLKFGVFFKYLKTEPKYAKIYELFKDKTMNEFLDSHRDIFLKIISEEKLV